METEGWGGMGWGRGARDRRGVFNGYRESVLEAEEDLEMDGGDGSL